MNWSFRNCFVILCSCCHFVSVTCHWWNDRETMRLAQLSKPWVTFLNISYAQTHSQCHPEGTHGPMSSAGHVMGCEHNCSRDLLACWGDILNHPGENISGQNSILVVKSKYKAAGTELFPRALLQEHTRGNAAPERSRHLQLLLLRSCALYLWNVAITLKNLFERTILNPSLCVLVLPRFPWRPVAFPAAL